MKVFKGFNQSGKDVCPVCETNSDKETVLIGIEGTEKGRNMKATQVHLECLDLRIRKGSDETRDIIYQLVDKEAQCQK